jgi:hypothetical protein
MDARGHSLNIRTGRFLWMEETARKRYLATLKKRIAEGYFSSDRILVSLVDEMAPVFNDFLGDDPEADSARA